MASLDHEQFVLLGQLHLAVFSVWQTMIKNCHSILSAKIYHNANPSVDRHQCCFLWNTTFSCPPTFLPQAFRCFLGNQILLFVVFLKLCYDVHKRVLRRWDYTTIENNSVWIFLITISIHRLPFLLMGQLSRSFPWWLLMLLLVSNFVDISWFTRISFLPSLLPPSWRSSIFYSCKFLF